MTTQTGWRTAIVTGAASGIGRCFAETLARRGTAVGLIDIAAEGLAIVADGIRARGGRLEVRAADVSAPPDVSAAVAALVSALGGLDLLIHCAAILGPGHFADQSPEAFERVIRIDLLGTANVVRAALPALRQSGGAAACLASTAAVHGWPALGAYSAAKFGVAGFCDAIRGELAREGVGLTTVFPLLIDTPLLTGTDIPPILRQGRRLAPQAVVDKTLTAVTRRRARVFIPGSVRVVASLHGCAPSLLDWYGRRFGFSGGSTSPR
jgi:NAD(P)-dependent dehydrogenase (short-subunit alcohol dehydrogenase family)